MNCASREIIKIRAVRGFGKGFGFGRIRKRQFGFTFLLTGRYANRIFYGEFDSGSERTLAACLRHASRTG